MTRVRCAALYGLLLIPAFGQITGFPAADRISRENRPRLDSLVGNGIDAATGAFVTEQQLLLLQGVRPLGFTLYYNSLLTTAAGVLGRGWSHEYEAYLDGTPGGVVTVHWDINRKNSFRFVGAAQGYEPIDEAAAYDRLERLGTSWRLTLLDRTEYRFGPDGELQWIQNRLGQRIELIRSDGRLTLVGDGSSKIIRLFYDESGNRLVSVEDNADRVVGFAYNASGLLDSITGPAALGLAEGPIFPTARVIPDNGTLTTTIDVTTSTRIGLVQLVSTGITHPRLRDLVVRLRSPRGTTVELTTGLQSGPWNLDRTLLRNFQGEDSRGTWTLVVQDTRPGETGRLNGWRMRFTEPTGSVFYAYGVSGEILRCFDQDGRSLYANRYDALGRVSAQDDGRLDNQVAEVSYAETGAGVRTAYRDRAGAESVLEHDAGYHLLAVTDSLRARTTYGYNARGDRTSTRDPLGREARITVADDGTIASYVDTAGAVWTFDHSDGDLVSVRDPLGKRTEFRYENHRLTRVRNAACLADSSCNGVRKSYGGDGEILSNLLSDGAGISYTWRNGRPVGATRPADSGTETAEYDAAGRLIVSRDAAGFRTRYTYNAASQILTQTDPLGLVTAREYDLRGQVIRSTNARGDVTTFSYDGNGNLVSRTNPLGETTRFFYDGEDRLVRTENARRNGTTSEYDAAGRLVRRTDDTGVTLRFEYDAAGNRTATFDSNGVALERVTYDERDLVLVSADAFGSRTTTQYDQLARPISVRDALGQAEVFNYDRNDRLDTVRDRLNRTTTTTYASDDVVTSITNARGESLEFEYDAANRLRRIRTPEGRTASFGYDRRDLLSFEQFDDVVHEYLYDDAGRLTRADRHLGEVVDYDLDANGNTTAVRARYAGESSSTIRLRFDYDALNRVTRYQDRDGNVLRYSYNGAGNLEVLTYPDGKQVRYFYDAGERLAEIVDWADRRTRYTYDRNGNVTRVILPNGVTQEMVYDRGGRLLRRTDRSGSSVIVDVSYTYDELDRLADVKVTPLPAPYLAQPAAMTYNRDDQLVNFNGIRVQYDSRGALTFGPLGNGFAQFAYDLSGNLSRAGVRTYSYNELDQLIRIDAPEGSTRLVVNPVPSLSQVLVRTAPNGNVTRYVWGPGLVYEETGGSIRTYHYNFAGSTVALVDGSGAVTATIAYGPYGEAAAQTGVADTPFQYGGVFGVITDANGLISMRYRWYSPQIRRFLSEDSEFGRPGLTPTLNRYAYGGLNPVSLNDPSGRLLGTLFGAVAGAAVNVAARTAVSLITTGKLPTAGEIAGAAVEGAIVGALVGTCGPGCGVLGGAVIGGVGAAGGSVTQQLIDDGRVDPAQLGVDVGFGVAFGTLGSVGKAGKGARAFAVARRGAGPVRPASFARPRPISPNGATRQSARLLGPPPRSSILLRPKSTVPKRSALARLRIEWTAYRRELAKDVLVASVETGIADAASDALLPDPEGPRQTARMNSRTAGRAGVNQNQRSEFGEFRHWNIYVAALGLAGRPEPDPAPALGTF